MRLQREPTCYQVSSPGQSICQTPLSLLRPWLLTCNCRFRFMTDAARREQESLKKKIQPKLSLTLSSSVSRGNVSTPPRHSSGSLTPPVTPPITPSSSFRSSTPTGKPPAGDSAPRLWSLHCPFICSLTLSSDRVCAVYGGGFIGCKTLPLCAS